MKLLYQSQENYTAPETHATTTLLRHHYFFLLSVLPLLSFALTASTDWDLMVFRTEPCALSLSCRRCGFFDPDRLGRRRFLRCNFLWRSFLRCDFLRCSLLRRSGSRRQDDTMSFLANRGRWLGLIPRRCPDKKGCSGRLPDLFKRSGPRSGELPLVVLKFGIVRRADGLDDGWQHSRTVGELDW
jgi:hypothetical protein